MIKKQEPEINGENFGIFERQNKSFANSGLTIVTILLILLSGLIGFYFGDNHNKSQVTTQVEALKTYTDEELTEILDESAYDFELYKSIVATLKSQYVDLSKIDEDKLFEGSLKGLVEAVDDPATNYFTKEDYSEYRKSEFEGSFQGIGVRLEYRDNFVTIEEVFEGSPALNAGIEIGWIIYKVDDQDVVKEPIENIVSKVRGDAGTKVKIQFLNPSSGEFIDKEVIRNEVKVESMRLKEVDSDTVIFEVSRFLEPTTEQWRAKWDENVNEILSKGYENIILDLRNNGGGYLDAAIYAANDFIDPGGLILVEKSRIRGDIETKAKTNSQRLKDKNVVILINENTASASEILAGALKYHKDYPILGKRSFGKGTVQTTLGLPNGGALKYTIEYWVLPDGKRLDTDNPIYPDREVVTNIDQVKQGVDIHIEEAIKESK